MSTGEKQQVRLHIRWMIRRDMPEVLRIEQASHDYPWCEEDFLRCLRQRNCIGMVAEVGEKVVGFMIYELHKTKLHIMNFAVHPDCRRAGIRSQQEVREVRAIGAEEQLLPSVQLGLALVGVDADPDGAGGGPGVGQVLGPPFGTESEELVGDGGLFLGLEVGQFLEVRHLGGRELESEAASFDRVVCGAGFVHEGILAVPGRFSAFE